MREVFYLMSNSSNDATRSNFTLISCNYFKQDLIGHNYHGKTEESPRSVNIASFVMRSLSKEKRKNCVKKLLFTKQEFVMGFCDVISLFIQLASIYAYALLLRVTYAETFAISPNHTTRKLKLSEILQSENVIFSTWNVMFLSYLCLALYNLSWIKSQLRGLCRENIMFIACLSWKRHSQPIPLLLLSKSAVTNFLSRRERNLNSYEIVGNYQLLFLLNVLQLHKINEFLYSSEN